MENVLVVSVSVLAAAVLLYPRLAKARLWRATITPLASIIGSGFLVLGPILDASYGLYAPLIMALLCLGAYLFGGAIRYNISALAAAAEKRSRTVLALEFASSWALAFAYVISVAYYLNLLGAFSVSLTAMNDAYHGRLVTSGVYATILLVGWTHGFRALERMEQVSVGVKLTIIAGLLFGLGWFFVGRLEADGLYLNPPQLSWWSGTCLAFGLIVTVQGFETSRYLGDDYGPEIRMRSMRLAQGISTAIYMVYIGLLAYVFAPGTLVLKETAIIDLMHIVAPILPALLVAAALSAQFSAAVADTSGSGGLLAEVTGGRLSPRAAYGILVAIGLFLTWGLNVFEIISYASRAFAFYYALQAAIAALTALPRPGQRLLAGGFFALALLGLAIVLFGTPVDV